jgi:hypothetical protein
VTPTMIPAGCSWWTYSVTTAHKCRLGTQRSSRRQTCAPIDSASSGGRPGTGLRQACTRAWSRRWKPPLPSSGPTVAGLSGCAHALTLCTAITTDMSRTNRSYQRQVRPGSISLPSQTSSQPRIWTSRCQPALPAPHLAYVTASGVRGGKVTLHGVPVSFQPLELVQAVGGHGSPAFAAKGFARALFVCSRIKVYHSVVQKAIA